MQLARLWRGRLRSPGNLGSLATPFANFLKVHQDFNSMSVLLVLEDRNVDDARRRQVRFDDACVLISNPSFLCGWSCCLSVIFDIDDG